MSGFVIFALVLTFAYVVYFSVMITLDLHGKKDDKSTEEETIDVSDMASEEQPVAVAESKDDSDLENMTYTELATEDGLRVVNPTGVPTPGSTPVNAAPIEPMPTEAPVTSQELNEEHEAHMEHIETQSQCSYLPDEFMQSLTEKHNKRKIEKKNARDKM